MCKFKKKSVKININIYVCKSIFDGVGETLAKKV